MKLPLGKSGSAISKFALRIGIGSPSDQYLAAALAEIEEAKLHKPTWASALSQSGGDEPKAKALYIRMRGYALENHAKPRTKLLAEIETLMADISQIDQKIVLLRQETAGLKDKLPYATTSIQRAQRFSAGLKIISIEDNMKTMSNRKQEFERVCAEKREILSSMQ